MGQFDEGGYFVAVDRLNDMIIVGGDNVYSGEVERVVGGYPGVAEVACSTMLEGKRWLPW